MRSKSENAWKLKGKRDNGCSTLCFYLLCVVQHLEQEKHELRRRFENKEGEWEGRVSELESDVKQLQDELEKQQVHLREADREKTRAVQELSEQNQRLLDQLSRVSLMVAADEIKV